MNVFHLPFLCSYLTYSLSAANYYFHSLTHLFREGSQKRREIQKKSVMEILSLPAHSSEYSHFEESWISLVLWHMHFYFYFFALSHFAKNLVCCILCVMEKCYSGLWLYQFNICFVDPLEIPSIMWLSVMTRDQH